MTGENERTKSKMAKAGSSISEVPTRPASPNGPNHSLDARRSQLSYSSNEAEIGDKIGFLARRK